MCTERMLGDVCTTRYNITGNKETCQQQERAKDLGIPQKRNMSVIILAYTE